MFQGSKQVFAERWSPTKKRDLNYAAIAYSNVSSLKPYVVLTSNPGVFHKIFLHIFIFD